MPLRDPEARREWGRNYRKRKMQNGYGKWLYARRKARFDDAEEFRSVLMFIANGKFGDISTVAWIALEESMKRHDAVGDPPLETLSENSNGAPPKADTLVQALAKLGLGPRPR